jgi:hypothetical protein
MKPSNSHKSKKQPTLRTPVAASASVETIGRRLWRFLEHNFIASLIVGIVVYSIEERRHSTTQIELLIYKEAELALGDHSEENLKRYGALFSEDARIINYGTKQVWERRDNIISRLRPLHFAQLVHHPIGINVEGNSAASAETDTIFVQDRPVDMIANGKESWRFTKPFIGEWKVKSFEYNR